MAQKKTNSGTAKKATTTTKTTTVKAAENAAKKQISAKSAEEATAVIETTEIPAPTAEVVAEKPQVKVEVKTTEPKSAPSNKVKILYIDSALPYNQIKIGVNRYITGSGRIFTVTKDEFEAEFMTPTTIYLLNCRKFIVLDGLTDEERLQYNCAYAESEVIRAEGMFDTLFTCPIEKAKEIFEGLCQQHRRMVEKRFLTAWDSGDNRITRDRVEALNEISKRDFADGTGAFTPIIKAINARMN